MRGGRGADTIFGGPGTDVLFGDRDDDLLFGDEGTDVLFGGPGDDDIVVLTSRGLRKRLVEWEKKALERVSSEATVLYEAEPAGVGFGERSDDRVVNAR